MNSADVAVEQDVSSWILRTSWQSSIQSSPSDSSEEEHLTAFMERTEQGVKGPV